MKKCPRCKTVHEKKGIYCSRNCANKRVFSLEALEKKSIASKKWWENLSPKQREEHTRKHIHTSDSLKKLKETWKEKNNLPWEERSRWSKRHKVFEEQNFHCNKCGLSEWMDKIITLEIEHKNGNHTDNSRHNLEGLCPNCHSQTPTWRGRNKKKPGLIA